MRVGLDTIYTHWYMFLPTVIVFVLPTMDAIYTFCVLMDIWQKQIK